LLAAAVFFLGFSTLATVLLALVTFLRNGAVPRLALDLDWPLLVLEPAAFLTLADANPRLVGDFLSGCATLFLGNRCLVDCLREAERFVSLLVVL
jgi:hypothetical protein